MEPNRDAGDSDVPTDAQQQQAEELVERILRLRERRDRAELTAQVASELRQMQHQDSQLEPPPKLSKSVQANPSDASPTGSTPGSKRIKPWMRWSAVGVGIAVLATVALLASGFHRGRVVGVC